MNAPARGIRSYVLRAGRITPAQKRALDELLPRFGIPYAPAALDLNRVFGRAAPRVLEIGFGNGDTLVELAASIAGTRLHRRGSPPARRWPLPARGRIARAREHPRDRARRRRGARAPGRTGIARRSPALFPGSLAQEAPSQAAHRPARLRGARRKPADGRRAIQAGDRLGAVRGMDAGSPGGVARVRE